MLRFGSPEWIDALDSAAHHDEGLRRAAAGVSLVIGQEVTDGPTAIRWHIVFDGTDVAVHPGASEDADLTFSQDRPTAVAISTGRMSARTAFVMGAVRVEGDTAVALRHAPTLAKLDDVFATVRAETEY